MCHNIIIARIFIKVNYFLDQKKGKGVETRHPFWGYDKYEMELPKQIP